MMAGSNLKSWPKELGHPKTCPMSRHAALIANGLRSKRKGDFGMVLRDAGFDVDHMAEALEGTVVALWDARRFLEWEALPPTGKLLVNGHWVPIKTDLED